MFFILTDPATDPANVDRLSLQTLVRLCAPLGSLCPVEMITPTPTGMPGTSTLDWDSPHRLLNSTFRLLS